MSRYAVYRLYAGLGLQLRNCTLPEEKVPMSGGSRTGVSRGAWQLNMALAPSTADEANMSTFAVLDYDARMAVFLGDVRDFVAGIIETLERLGGSHGFPRKIRVAGHWRFLRTEVRDWAQRSGIALIVSCPKDHYRSVLPERFLYGSPVCSGASFSKLH